MCRSQSQTAHIGFYYASVSVCIVLRADSHSRESLACETSVHVCATSLCVKPLLCFCSKLCVGRNSSLAYCRMRDVCARFGLPFLHVVYLCSFLSHVVLLSIVHLFAHFPLPCTWLSSRMLFCIIVPVLYLLSLCFCVSCVYSHHILTHILTINY